MIFRVKVEDSVGRAKTCDDEVEIEEIDLVVTVKVTGFGGRGSGTGVEEEVGIFGGDGDD